MIARCWARRGALLLMMAVALGAGGGATAAPNGLPDGPRSAPARLSERLDQAIVPQEVVLRFEPQVPALVRNELLRSLGAELLRAVERWDVEHWRLPAGILLDDALAWLRASGLVRWAEPNVRRFAYLLPNDPQFAKQWHLHSTGQVVSGAGVGSFTPAVDADLDLPEAWDATTGSSEVLVAVIDDSLDVAHPELRELIWLNAGELVGEAAPAVTTTMGAHCASWPGYPAGGVQDANGDGVFNIADYACDDRVDLDAGRYGDGELDPSDLLDDPPFADGVDDDGNGLVDDIVGWNFAADSNDPSAVAFSGDGHGTAVAGCVGTMTNNGTGLAGPNWNVRLMALPFDFTSAQETAAFAYALEQGAPIVNASWGGPQYSEAEFAAVDALMDEDVLLVAAAGNYDTDNDVLLDYPASLTLPNVLSVAGSYIDDALIEWTQFGQFSVDVAAPGDPVLTTMPIHDFNAAQLSYGGGGAVGWGFTAGTSFSSPLVAGIAALAKAARPSADTQELKGRILAGVEAVAAPEARMSTDGRASARGALDAVTGPVLVVAELRVSDPAGNGDGVAAPGELVDLQPVLEAFWQAPGTVTLTVASRDAWVSVVTATAAYGPLALGAAAAPTAPATVQIAAAAEGYRRALLDVDLYDGGVWRARRTVALELGSLVVGTTMDGTISRDDYDDTQRWHVTVPPGRAWLEIATTAGADLDLYVWTGGPGAGPGTEIDADEDGNETVRIEQPAPGVYYAAVHNYDLIADTDYTIRADMASAPPAPTAPTLGLLEDQSGSVQVYGNDPDDADEDLDFALLQDGSLGTATVSRTGLLTYTPNGDAHGNDDVVVEVRDGDDNAAAVTVDVTIAAQNDAPGQPDVLDPDDDEELATLRPTLRGRTTFDVDGDELSYAFEVYRDAALTKLDARTSGVVGGGSTVTWQVSEHLGEGPHWWRLRANDGTTSGPWSALATFTIALPSDEPGDVTEPPADATDPTDAPEPTTASTGGGGGCRAGTAGHPGHAGALLLLPALWLLRRRRAGRA